MNKVGLPPLVFLHSQTKVFPGAKGCCRKATETVLGPELGEVLAVAAVFRKSEATKLLAACLKDIPERASRSAPVFSFVTACFGKMPL